MPTGWNDLSNEIRKIIIEYVIADKTVTFVPRHAATRGARKKDQAIAGQPPHFPLLLVSKQFLTYAELNDALLKNATIKYESGRDLTALDGRFGKGGIESLRSLHLDFSQVSQLRIPSKLEKRLKQLQKMTVTIKNARAWLQPNTTLREVVKVAKGQQIPSRDAGLWSNEQITTETIGIRLRHLLDNCIMGSSRNFTAWLLEFLRVTPEEPFERSVRFYMCSYRYGLPRGSRFSEEV